MFGALRLRPVSREELFGPMSRQFDRMLNDVFGQDFFEGVAARFAGFELNQIQHLGLAAEQEIVEPEKDAAAGGAGESGPRGLCGASPGKGKVHVRGAGARDFAEDGAGERRADRNGVASQRGERDSGSQAFQKGGIDGHSLD